MCTCLSHCLSVSVPSVLVRIPGGWVGVPGVACSSFLSYFFPFCIFFIFVKRILVSQTILSSVDLIEHPWDGQYDEQGMFTYWDDHYGCRVIFNLYCGDKKWKKSLLGLKNVYYVVKNTTVLLAVISIQVYSTILIIYSYLKLKNKRKSHVFFYRSI